jgi:Sugar (and other) transporter
MKTLDPGIFSDARNLTRRLPSACQVMPVYNAEMSPPHFRGAMNILFQLFVTIGILCAGLINYGADFIKGGWGWRLSLGLAGECCPRST